MKYVALLSGGKDSCFNLLHCLKNGHELVAAASLRPEQGKDELDSYLYQTVGQDAIEFVARALDVPLYRGVIVGTAVEQGSEYGTRSSRKGVEGDETEDLYDLLATVKSHHPDIQGVSVGAILSNYQRVRVEHVQDELLSEMIGAGMEAVLIKVAGIGLTIKHLGKSLEEMKPTLMKLNDLYGSHVCGEGGEYESLTLDCPLFKSRIVLTEVETVIHSDSAFATVAYLRVKNAYLEPKPTPDASADSLAVPLLLDEKYQAIRDAVAEAEKKPNSSRVFLPDSAHSASDFAMDTRRNGKWVAVSNVQVECPANEPIENEVTKCFHLLQEQLLLHNLTLAHIINMNLFLASMDDFARVNAVYSTFFGTSPPSRACVALDLPSGIRVRIDCIAFVESSERQALHVQSQSYWAPANIGPYSQAILAGERLLISGQIGLIPSSITLPSPRSLGIETALSMQHVTRVVAALRNGWEGYTQAAVHWLSDAGLVDAVRKSVDTYGGDEISVKLLVAVKALPKGALVEKQVMVHTGRAWVEEEDSDDEVDGKKELVLKSVEPFYKQGDIAANNLNLHWETSQSRDSPDSAGCTLICLRDYTESNIASLRTHLKHIQALQRSLDHALSIRCFYSADRTNFSNVRAFLSAIFDKKQGIPPVASIPSRYIATRLEDDWDTALLIMN
ncbi:hypothetical protein BDP27DRAFT_1413934 [Rhodocollybia butyracea]|uniref:Diphthine--ammonia ligase n=1 Tax=Rhodocollybia butyracea TaxID=206335 RepID=A0A9P5UF14_9AGAR|nr:hypothetical protein BDP27DRAFT_1413934 [Rhodocollybia butyracea]